MHFRDVLRSSCRDQPLIKATVMRDSCDYEESPVPQLPAPSTPVQKGATTRFHDGWPSGRRKLRTAWDASRWPDGAKVGRGHGQPYLMAKYARAVAKGEKTVEGRPGGGWLAKGIAPNDYINFKIPGHQQLALVVRNAITRHTFQVSSELMLQPTGRHRTACRMLFFL